MSLTDQTAKQIMPYMAILSKSPSEAFLTSDVVAESAGVPYRTLMRWVEDGLIAPVFHAKRHRVPVQWSAKNLREVTILAQLRKCNLSLQQIRGIMGYLRDLGDNPLSSGQFMVVLGVDSKPRELVKIRNGVEALALMRKHRGQLMLPLWAPTRERSA